MAKGTEKTAVQGYYAATRVDHATRPPLAGDEQAEVCIVGGGLAGLAAAQELADAGVSVVLVEAREVGFGASGRNGGFVGAGYSRDISILERSLGLEHARGLFDLSREGVERVRRNIGEHAIPGADARPGVLVVLRREGGGDVEDHVRHMRAAYGYPIEFWPTGRVREHVKSERYFQGFYSGQSLHIHPLNYVIGLARACEAAGVRIFEGTEARAFGRDGAKHVVRSAGGSVRANHVVLCQSGYGRALHGAVGRAVLPVATYVVASAEAPALLDQAIATEAAVADMRRAGDYYRRLPDGRLLWGGRITTQRSEPARLASLMKGDITSVYPQLAGLEIEHAWAGLMGYAVHKMPIVRELEPGVWVSTAFGGHGLNATAGAGRAIAEAITRRSRRLDLFAPFGARFGGGPLGRAGTQLAYWWYQARDRMDER